MKDIVKFYSGGKLLAGTIRTPNKLLDWTLVDGIDGKRYLVADNEFVSFSDDSATGMKTDEKIDSEGQAVKEGKKRGRPPRNGKSEASRKKT